MKWTSLEAYFSIYDQLPERRRQALSLLLENYNREGEKPPTAQELERYNKMTGYRTHTGVWKRLPELADKLNAIHRTKVRYCEATGNLALTWTPGPIPGTELGDPQTSSELKQRLRRLLLFAPGIPPSEARFIMKVETKTFEKLWQEVLSEGGMNGGSNGGSE